MSLLNKVNFTKGWPHKAIVEEVLNPASGVVIEAGFIGRRSHSTPEDTWVLGITSLHQEPFIFRNDSQDPDAQRGAHNGDYVQVPYGGVQGISFQNPLEIETIQFEGNPVPGDLLYATSGGKLAVAVEEDGTVLVPGVVVLAVVNKAEYAVGQHNYIRVTPVTKFLSDSAPT